VNVDWTREDEGQLQLIGSAAAAKINAEATVQTPKVGRSVQDDGIFAYKMADSFIPLFGSPAQLALESRVQGDGILVQADLVFVVHNADSPSNTKKELDGDSVLCPLNASTGASGRAPAPFAGAEEAVLPKANTEAPVLGFG
jgi:hypothetical protein